MAKKDMFDFEDFEDSSPILGDEVDDRNPTTSVTGDISSSFMDSFTGVPPTDTVSKVAEAMLPSIVGDESADKMLDSIVSFKDQVEESAIYVKKAAKPLLKKIKNSTDANGFFGSKIHGIVDYLTDDDDRSRGPSKEQLLLESITRDVNNAIGARDEQLTRDLFNKHVEYNMAMSSDKKLAYISAGINQLNTFNDKIARNYFVKSLELQYRQLYVSKDSHEVSKLGFDTLSKLLTSVIKNTALPDFLKLRSTEALKQKVRNSIVEGITTSAMAEGTPLEKAMAAASKKLNTLGKNAGDMLSEAIDMQEMMGGLEDGPSKASMVGDGLGDKAKEFAGRIVGRELRSTEFGRKLDVNVNDFLLSPSEALDEKASKVDRKAWWGIKKKALKGAAKLFRERDNEGITQLSRESGDANTFYSIRTDNTINNIIPDYLSKILKELNGIRTGTDGIEFKYDRDRQSIITATQLKESVEKDVSSVTDSTSTSTAKIIKSMNAVSDTELTSDETDTILTKLFEHVKNGGTVNSIRLQDSGFFETFDDKQLGLKAKILINSFITNTDGSINSENANSMNEYLVDFKSGLNSISEDIVRRMMDDGKTDALEDSGFISYNADTKTYDMNMDNIRQAKFDTIQSELPDIMDSLNSIEYTEDERQYEDGYLKRYYNKFLDLSLKDAKTLTADNLTKFNEKLQYIFDKSIVSKGLKGAEKKFRVSLGRYLRIDYRPEHIGGKHMFYARVADITRTSEGAKLVDKFFNEHMPESLKEYANLFKELITKKYTKVLDSDDLSSVKLLLNGKIENLSKILKENENLTVREAAGVAKDKLNERVNVIKSYISKSTREDMVNDALSVKDKTISKGKDVLKKTDEILSKSDKYNALKEKEEAYRKELAKNLDIKGGTKQEFTANLVKSKKDEFLKTEAGKKLTDKYTKTVNSMSEAKKSVSEELKLIDKVAKESLSNAIKKENGEEVKEVDTSKLSSKSKIVNGYKNLVENAMNVLRSNDAKEDDEDVSDTTETTISKDTSKVKDESEKHDKASKSEEEPEDVSLLRKLTDTVTTILDNSKINSEKEDARYEEEQLSEKAKEEKEELLRKAQERQDKKNAEAMAEKAALDKDGSGYRDGSIKDQKNKKSKGKKTGKSKNDKSTEQKFKEGGLWGMMGGLTGLLKLPFTLIGGMATAITGLAGFAGFGTAVTGIHTIGKALKGIGWAFGKGFDAIKYILTGIPDTVEKLKNATHTLHSTIKGIAKFLDKILTGGKITAGAAGIGTFIKKIATSKWTKAGAIAGLGYALLGTETKADGVTSMNDMIEHVEEQTYQANQKELNVSEDDDSDTIDTVVTTAEVGATAYAATKIAKPIIKRRHGIVHKAKQVKTKTVDAAKVIAKGTANLKEMKDKKVILDTLKKKGEKVIVMDKANAARKVMKGGKEFIEAGILKGKTFTPLKAFKKLPGLGLVLGAGFAAKRVTEGDFVGAAMEFASGALTTIPWLGIPLSIGMDMLISERDDKLAEAKPLVDTDDKTIEVTESEKPELNIINKDTLVKPKESISTKIIKAESKLSVSKPIGEDTVHKIKDLKPKITLHSKPQEPSITPKTPILRQTPEPKSNKMLKQVPATKVNPSDYKPYGNDSIKRQREADIREAQKFDNNIVTDVTIGQSELKGELGVIAYIIRYVETNNDYRTVGDIGDGAGISFGAYQFTMNSGSLKLFMDNYIALKPLTIDRAKAYRKQMSGTSFNGNVRRFTQWLKKIAATKHGVEAQDKTFVEHYYNRAIRHIPKQLKSIEVKIHVIDAYHNGGGAYVATNIYNDNIDDIESVRIAYWKSTDGWSKYKNGWLNRLTKIRKLIQTYVYDGKDIPIRSNENIIKPSKEPLEPDHTIETNTKKKSSNFLIDIGRDAVLKLMSMISGKSTEELRKGAITSRTPTSHTSTTNTNSTVIPKNISTEKPTKSITVTSASDKKVSKINQGNGKFAMLGQKVKNISEIPRSTMNGGKITNITIHCTYTNTGTNCGAKCVDNMHRARGWSGCGYHFIILPDGTIEYGRNINHTGAHVGSHNKGNIGISYAGGRNGKTGGNDIDACSEEQMVAIVQLAHYLAKLHGISKDHIVGHKEFPKVHKSCPNLTMANVRDANVISYEKSSDRDSDIDNGSPEKELPTDSKSISKKPGLVKLNKSKDVKSTNDKKNIIKKDISSNAGKKIMKAAGAITAVTQLAANTPIVDINNVSNITPNSQQHVRLVEDHKSNIPVNDIVSNNGIENRTKNTLVEPKEHQRVIIDEPSPSQVIQIDMSSMNTILSKQLDIQGDIYKLLVEAQKGKSEKEKDKEKDIVGKKITDDKIEPYEIKVNTSPLVSTKAKGRYR